MRNVIQSFNEDDMMMAVRGRQARNTIGNALGRAYPDCMWGVDVNIEGGVAQITCPNISLKFGMVLHLTRDTVDLERTAVRMGGELLERFRVDRERTEFSHIRRNIAGEALGARRGEQ